MTIEEITVSQANDWLAQRQAMLIDIRAEAHFADCHVRGAFPLNAQTFPRLLAETARETPLLILCYHGISSRQAAAMLMAQGFSHVYSVAGGMAAWREALPATVVQRGADEPASIDAAN